VASAGHLPVLHVTPAGAHYVRDGRGPALGMLPTAAYREARLDLGGDDRLLLYSDGLVERRREDLDTGLDALRRAAESSSTDPQGLL
jgi:serine phosphatase RsbU (regulator of sigma subunit)